MISLIDEKLHEIKTLCEKYRVIRLDIFGSATSDGFDPSKSDMDFIVEFSQNMEFGPWMSEYFDFKQELEKLFGCTVDLVMSGAMKNPHFIREANRTRRLVYAA